MKTLTEIKRKLPYIKPITGNTYSSEISVNGKKGSVVFGSVVFGFNENGWEHVSFAPYNQKTPTWDMMCQVKDIFWDDEEIAIQIHPKKSEYVNMKNNCLHLWAKIGGMEGPDWK